MKTFSALKLLSIKDIKNINENLETKVEIKNTIKSTENLIQQNVPLKETRNIKRKILHSNKLYIEKSLEKIKV